MLFKGEIYMKKAYIKPEMEEIKYELGDANLCNSASGAVDPEEGGWAPGTDNNDNIYL